MAAQRMQQARFHQLFQASIRDSTPQWKKDWRNSINRQAAAKWQKRKRELAEQERQQKRERNLRNLAERRNRTTQLSQDSLADASDTEQSVQPAETWRNKSAEQTAASKFQLAKRLLKRNPAAARRRLQDLIVTYPDTESAALAGSLLKRLK